MEISQCYGILHFLKILKYSVTIKDVEISGNCVNGWMPDIIPSATYIHQESIHGVPHPEILSPPMKILHHEAYTSAEGIALLYQDNAPTNDIDQLYGTCSSKCHYPSFTFSR